MEVNVFLLPMILLFGSAAVAAPAIGNQLDTFSAKKENEKRVAATLAAIARTARKAREIGKDNEALGEILNTLYETARRPSAELGGYLGLPTHSITLPTGATLWVNATERVGEPGTRRRAGVGDFAATGSPVAGSQLNAQRRAWSP